MGWNSDIVEENNVNNNSINYSTCEFRILLEILQHLWLQFAVLLAHGALCFQSSYTQIDSEDSNKVYIRFSHPPSCSSGTEFRFQFKSEQIIVVDGPDNGSLIVSSSRTNQLVTADGQVLICSATFSVHHHSLTLRRFI